MELVKYKICPECGKHNPPSLLECRYCEADLTNVKVVDNAAEDAVLPQADKVVSFAETELVRVCECGAENAPQARKCKACGEDISDIIPIHVEKKSKKTFTYELSSYDGTFSAAFDKPLIVVGREAELKDHLHTKMYVSRQHARLTVVADKVFIENLSRTNKTFINNDEIPDETPTALHNGDEIGLGGKIIDGSRQDKAAYLMFRVKS
jgi:ribosomal protein L40E